MVNIGVVDSPSPLMDEVLNLLTRRNLLYKVVPAPDRTLDLTVQLGTPDFPAEAAANPYEFAARVRAKLGDDKRLVRLYGTSTVIARLTGDKEPRAAVSALVRAAGASRAPARRPSASACWAAIKPTKLAAYGGNADARSATSSSRRRRPSSGCPDFNTCAIIDLEAMK